MPDNREYQDWMEEWMLRRDPEPQWNTLTDEQREYLAQFPDEQELDASEGFIISEMPIMGDEADLPEDYSDAELEIEADDEMFLSHDELTELHNQQMFENLPPHLRQKFGSRKKSGKTKKHKPAPERGSAKGKKKKQMLNGIQD